MTHPTAEQVCEQAASAPLSKEQWIAEAVAVFKRRVPGLNDEDATYLAEACWGNCTDDPMGPEEAVDSELSYWEE